MKIAVSAVEGNLNADVDPRFGRAGFFVVVDSSSAEFEAIPNPNVTVGGGAGIQSAQLVLEKGAQAVITGSCGPNAFRVLEAAGVQIFEGVQGTVQDMIDAWRNDRLTPVKQPTGGHGKRASHVSQSQLSNSDRHNDSTSDQNEIKGIKEEISNIEERLRELNQKLEQMNKK